MTGRATLEVGGVPSLDVEVALAEDAHATDHVVVVDDAAAFAIGDEVAVGFTITSSWIADNDMGVTPFADQWKAIHRRVVVDVDLVGQTLTLDVPLREDVRSRDGGAVRRILGLIREVGVEDLAIANAVSEASALAADRVHALQFSGVVDGWVKNVHSFAPPGHTQHLQSGGVLVVDSARITLDSLVLSDPQHRGEGGNGYLVEVQRANEVLVVDVSATGGRHNFIQNWDFGTSGCVFLRCVSAGGVSENDTPFGPVSIPSFSELHHSLARANLFDDCTFDDGWQSVNRGTESSGAGHAGTENILWNTSGAGIVKSLQRGQGYIIGTTDIRVVTEPDLIDSVRGLARNTEPVDFMEGVGRGGALVPASLYEDMRARRLAGAW
jgi:hypothetical protein